MANFGRFLAAALCAAAVICAAAEPEASWGSQAADVAELIARSGPIHSLVAPARAASEAISFLQSEVSELVPEELMDGAGEKKSSSSSSVVKHLVAAVAGKKAAASMGKSGAKKTAPQSKSAKKTETSIAKVKKAIKKQTTGIKETSQEQKVVAKAARKASIAAGPNDTKVKSLKAKAKAMKTSMNHSLHKGSKKWSKKNVHLPKMYKGKLSLPSKFHVPSHVQTVKKIWEATPPGIHTDAEYWKLKQLRREYRYKQGYQKMRGQLLRKELRRHYASKLVRDHMRRKVDTLRRERALDEYGPGAHYKPFKWGEYDEPSSSASIVKQVSHHAEAKKKQQALKRAKEDLKDGN